MADSSSSFVRLVARFRVGLGFVSGIAVFWFATPTRMSIAAGLPIAIAGELIRIWAAGHLNKSREVTRSGPYRFVAHPLYLGSSLIGAGLAVGSGRLVVVGIVAAYLLVTLTAAIRNSDSSKGAPCSTRKALMRARRSRAASTTSCRHARPLAKCVVLDDRGVHSAE